MGNGCETYREFPTREEPPLVTWIVHIEAVAPGAVERRPWDGPMCGAPIMERDSDPGHPAAGASGNEP